MDVKQGLVALFGESPLNWAKWAVVFAVLVLGYAAAVPLSKKVAWRLGWARKRDIAKSRGHSVPATMVEKHPHGQPPHYNWHATYRYSMGGRQRQYHAYFKEPATPPLKLYLYYLNNPNKLFSYEEYHYENHKGIVMLALTALPWALAVAAMFLLKIELPGA